MDNLHFLRPEWLLLIPLWWTLAILISRKKRPLNWSQYIAPELLQALTVSQGKTRSGALWGLVIALTLSSIALAGPSWRQVTVPTVSNTSPLFVLIDLSPSMTAEDVAPSRIVRARLKLIDLLRARDDGQTALIAYSSAPHLVAPLTDDTNTIEALVPALHPFLMPNRGSNVESAVAMALERMESAGASSADLLLLTDGVTTDAERNLIDMLPASVHLSILGVGTAEGAPIPTQTGFLRSNISGDLILASLDQQSLQTLANRLGGTYADLSADDRDIQRILTTIAERDAANNTQQNIDYENWQDEGFWLLLPLILVAALAFRRGLVFVLSGLLLSSLMPQPSWANTWSDLWLTPDQQAQRAFEQGDVERAAELFESDAWRAYSQYQLQDYTQAAAGFETLNSAEALFNAGNALALDGNLPASIEAYARALELNPNLEDAQFNKTLVEELLEQQSQQQEPQGDSSQQQNDQNSEQSEQSSPDQQQGQQANQQPEQGQQNQDDSNQTNNQQASASEGDQSEPEGDAQTADAQSPDSEPSDTGDNLDSQADSSASDEDLAQLQQQMTQAEQQQQETQQSEASPAFAEQMQPTDNSEQGETLELSSEQWLRAIPDDPSGFLRRKFQYEAEMQRQQQRYFPQAPNSEEERY